MGFDFTGFVLSAPHSASSNATTTDEAENGVDRDWKPLSSDYVIPSPAVVGIALSQYRAAVLLRPLDGQTEYILWAANTADIRDLGDFEVSNEATVTFPSTSVNRVVILDDANRTISTLTSLVVRRGDTNALVELVGGGNFDPVSGVFTITSAATLAALGGGVSSARGDRGSAIYTISAPAFWWSKNDQYEVRFKWDGRFQRWVPLRGTPPRNLGLLFLDTTYTLSPAPIAIPVGEYLPGDSSNSAIYAAVRLGSRPDETSMPVAQPVGGSGFGGILVVTDDELTDFSFDDKPTLAGVVGQGSGVLLWNQTFVQEFAGQTIFYSYAGFVDQEEIEPIGPLETAIVRPLFISPIPGPTDYPFIRIGSRQPLQALIADDETALAALTVQEGQVGMALSTGRLRFSEVDVAKADPSSSTFNVNYLGVDVFYDGVSLTQRPVSLRQPVRLVNASGEPTVVDGKNHTLYIPDAVPTPSPGISGVLHVEDRTGTLPNDSSDPGIRPGGTSGLLRSIEGPWDLVLFASNGQISRIVTFDDEDETPRYRFQIPRGTAYVDLRKGLGGSEVILGREDLKRFDGRALYFAQTGAQPAVFVREARILSRVRRQFVLTGTERLTFRVGGAIFTWNASLNPGGVPTSDGGTFTPAQIAQSLDAVMTSGSAIVLGDRVALQTSLVSDGLHYGEIEIGFGPGGSTDLSGAAALGFLPGWIVRIASTTAVDSPPDLVWLPDNGSNLGVFRSPFNLDGSRDTIADVNHIARFNDVVLASSISAAPVVLLDRTPLEDVVGYDEGIFFRFQDGVISFPLENYKQVLYQFGEEKFSWANTHVENDTVFQPTTNLFLGVGQAIPNSFRLSGNGLRVSIAGSPLETLTLGEDFLLPDDGDPGIAVLVTGVGTLVQIGGRGTFSAGGSVFTDPSPNIDFVALGVKAGYQLKIPQGEAEGTYVVTEDAVFPSVLVVSPSFAVSGNTVPWELYKGVSRNELDLGIVADSQYTIFNHLPTDPFDIRVLSPLGEIPANPTAQSANRLVAILGDALAHDRGIAVRYGRTAGNLLATMVALQQVSLGRVGNSSPVPTPTSNRFANDDFSIRIGDKTYTFLEGNLIKVSSLTVNLQGDLIEVQIGTGALGVGSTVLSQFDGQDVIYVEEFLTPQDLPSGTVEYRISDGALNFPAVDMQAFGGTKAFLVETMKAEGGVDVTLNPIQGSLLFTTPLRAFQIVEVHYFQAENGTGELLLVPVDPEDPSKGVKPVEITEQLPLFVRLEPATPDGTGDVTTWNFNPTDRVIKQDITPDLWVGATLYNVGSSPVATFDLENNHADLELPVPDVSEVLISYAVIEAFGGEQTFTTSTSPIYRPPFRVEANRSQFTLADDRTTDMEPGKLLRVAEFPFYITASSYDPLINITTVDFIPETQLEAGSRDPGGDSLSLLSDIPLATLISSSAPEGFWFEVTAPYEPINRGFQSIIFHANLAALAVTGHILELGGVPFIIAGSTQSADGTRTQIDVTSFFPRGFAFGQDIAKISVRPVYAPQPIQFLGRGGVFPEEPYELVLFGERDAFGNLLPGRTLRPLVDYQINFDDGGIEFLNPPQKALQPTQILYLRHVQQRTITPVLSNEIVLYPRFIATFVHIEAPSIQNFRLGKILKATYTFSNPDTWFYRTVPLINYLGEVADRVALEVSAQLPSFGPAPAVVPAINNAEQGRTGLKAQLSDLEDTDRAARVFLDFYNQVIQAFEQVFETITGNIIGDRDGKFKFFVGRHKEIAPPGYEDETTGRLVERNLFSEVFFGYNPQVVFLRRDPLVDPTNFTISDDQLEGEYIDPDFLGDLQALQRELAANDVDDVILFTRTRKRLRLFPLRLEAFGRYRRLGSPSVYSRLFPERAEAFTLTDPGIGADLEADPIKPGVYAFRKKITRLSIKGSGGNFKIKLPKRASTFFKSIGDIGNPVLGNIQNVGDLNVRPRLPRARIYLYSPTGFPEADPFIVGAPSFSTLPRPAVIATPLPLGEFPIGENGLPDFSQLAAMGGETIDLTTGDPNLFTPAFRETNADRSFRPKVTFGRPDGRIIDVQTSDSVSFNFPPDPGPPDPETYTLGKSVFIGEILLGCILTFAKEDHVPGDIATLILSESDLLEVSEDPAAADAPIQLFRGDTVFVTPTDAEIQPAANIDDPATNSEKSAQLEGLPGFRVGFDIGIDRPDGEYRDITFPSFRDPSLIGLKEILGQKPPLPLSHLEADVRFKNGLTEPAPIPALFGGFTNDSGDYSLPYLYAQNTEIDQLGIVASSFTALFEDTGIPSAAYPDEIQGVDGTILGSLISGDPPAALLTDLDATPVATSGGYIPNSGIGDVSSFDVLLMETGQTATGLPPGSQGILSIGRADGGTSGSEIEPPRFVTPTAIPTSASGRIRYRLRSAMSFVNQGTLAFPPGIVVRRVGTVTQFDLTTISNAILVFNDGTPGSPTGGLNEIFSPAFFGAVQDNVVTLNLWTAPDLVNTAPVFLQSITIAFNNGAPTATGDAGASAITSIVADDEILYVDTPAPFVTIAPNPGLVPPVLPEDPLNPTQTISLWFTIDLDLTSAVGAGGASTTGYIEQDRLTLNDSFDMRTILPRNEPDVDSIPVFSELEIAFIASQTTDACTVNSPLEVNGGLPFTFLARSSSNPKVGTFDPLPGGTGRGTVRVMAFEGHGNTPIFTVSPVVFSAIPSSPYAVGATTPIAEGTGLTGTSMDRNFRISSDGVTLLALNAGSFTGIEAGDVCIISGSSDTPALASTKAGTYLIKHVVPPTTLSTEVRELSLQTKTLPFNTGQGWGHVVFPTIVQSNIDATNLIEVSSTTLESDGSSAWNPTGTLWLLTVFDPDSPNFQSSNFRIDYLSVNTTTNTFQVDITTATNLDGSITGSDAVAAIDALPLSTIITGFVRFDVRMDFSSEDALPRNLVGFDSGVTTAVGFRAVQITGTGTGAVTETFTFGGAQPIVIGAPGVDEVGVTAAVPITNTSFVDDPNSYVYQDVPQFVELNLSLAVWDSIHATNAAGITAILPGDTFFTDDGIPGFYAQAGVFFEPSWIRPTLNLAGVTERVVDAGHSVAITEIGFRDGTLFGEGSTEGVTWQIRRIRRFHDVLLDIGTDLGPLRYVYEIRRGTVTTFGPAVIGPTSTLYPYVVTATGGTQLGNFDDDLVNVNPGDLFRLFANDGVTLLEEVEIGGIEGPDQIWLKSPGIRSIPLSQVAGKPFQIYLRQVPVPHEQSNEQLLDQITDQVLFERRANLTTQQGGVVPVGEAPEDPRILRDTDTSINYAGLGIQSGDIVLIDPAGNLVGPSGIPTTGLEKGTRPFGDRSVPGRSVATPGQEVPFIEGAPSELDDNRGWYRITNVTQDELTVSSNTDFSSNPGGPFVTFGTDAEYAVLPTVSGSTAPFADPPGGPGVEGQMDLRPTAFAGTLGSPPNSFLGNKYSIAPLSYRVFRPSPLFSSEAVDLVLLMRERTKSFLEEFGVFFDETKFGSYFIFQKNQHIADLGNPLIPDEGKGVMSNALVDGVRGLINISPFANTTDGLSVLDRRFWVLDTRLDNEFPPGAPPGTPSYSTLASNANNPSAEDGDGRPVLTDRISDVLDNNDQFREQRYAWLDFRVNRETGILAAINRFIEQLPKKRREELRQLRLSKSVREAR